MLTPEQFAEGAPLYWDDAFRKMLTSTGAAPVDGLSAWRHSTTIYLAPREYQFQHTLELPRGCRMIGAGGVPFGSASTRLSFPGDAIGVWIPGIGYSRAERKSYYNGTIPGKHGGSGIHLENLQVRFRDQLSDVPGIKVTGLCHLNNIRVDRAPGDGILIQALEGGNPSWSRFHNVEITNAGGYGFHVPLEGGGNSSQMLIQHLSVIRSAKTGIVEAGKIGNLYLNPHVNNPTSQGYNFSINPAGHSTIIAPYEEQGVLSRELSTARYATIVGQNTVRWARNTKAFGKRGFEGVFDFRSRFSRIRAALPGYGAGSLFEGLDDEDRTVFRIASKLGQFWITAGRNNRPAIRIDKDTNEVIIENLTVKNLKRR